MSKSNKPMNKSVGGLGIEPMWNCVTCNHNQIHDNERDIDSLVSNRPRLCSRTSVINQKHTKFYKNHRNE